MREFGDLASTMAQRRRSSILESRLIDAVLDVIPTVTEPKMEDLTAKIRPILQSVAAQSPVQSDSLSSMGLKRSMQFLTRQLDERTEELSTVRVELSSKTSDLQEVREERDKCMTALEEAHECVSDYHRKLSAMERTVGHALVSKGEIKEKTTKLDESKRLNVQYKEALTAAEMRIESLQDSSTSQQEKLHSLEADLATWKSKAEHTSYDASECSKRAQELDIRASELETRLADSEAQRSTLSDQTTELEARHNETLAALSDMITIQKRSDAERDEMAATLQSQQRSIAQHEATIEALRSQLEVAHHQPLCATADSACAGTRFLDRDRATCMRALDKATGALEASLPTLSEGVLQLASNSNTKPCTAGLLGDVGNSSATAGRTPGQAQSQAVLAGNKLPDVNVENIIKELQQLHDVIHASCMFNHQDDDYKHTLYKALRDLWGSLEQRLSNILPPLATLTQNACEAVSEAQRREASLREALQDTHDALARTASDRQRSKELVAELQEQLNAEKQRANHEARETAVQAQTETLQHSTEAQRLSVRAEAAEAEASRSQQECQRLHAEYDHKVHALEAGMRARFVALRDSYQQQLDTLHMQVIEMDSRNPPKPPPELPSQPFSRPSRMTAPTQHHSMHADRQPDAFPAAPADTGIAHYAPPSNNMHGAHAYELSAHAEGVWSSAGETSLREELAAQEHRNRQRAFSEAAPRVHATQHTVNSHPDVAGDTHASPGRSRSAPRPVEPSVHSEPSLRDNAAVAAAAGESERRAPEHLLTTSQDVWPPMDAAAPFTVPASVSRSGDGGFQWLRGVQVPTAPGAAAPSDASASRARASYSFAADLPDDPLPDTNHLNGASAPAHVTARQAQIYSDPYSHSRQCSTSPSPRAIPTCDRHEAHACTHSHGYHSHMHQSMHVPSSTAPSSQHYHSSQAHWEHDKWYEDDRRGGGGLRGGVEGRSRPQSARPGGFNREGPPATAEAVHFASQHAGAEGSVRPQSAHPSDHWTLHVSPSPAKLAAGCLQPQRVSRLQSPNLRSTPTSRSQRATSRPKSAKSAKSPRPSKLPMVSPESATEAAVMSALKKAGILERLGDTSSRKKVKSTNKTSSIGRGRSRTPKQQSYWLL